MSSGMASENCEKDWKWEWFADFSMESILKMDHSFAKGPHPISISFTWSYLHVESEFAGIAPRRNF